MHNARKQKEMAAEMAHNIHANQHKHRHQHARWNLRADWQNHISVVQVVSHKLLHHWFHAAHRARAHNNVPQQPATTGRKAYSAEGAHGPRRAAMDNTVPTSYTQPGFERTSHMQSARRPKGVCTAKNKRKKQDKDKIASEEPVRDVLAATEMRTRQMIRHCTSACEPRNP